MILFNKKFQPTLVQKKVPVSPTALRWYAVTWRKQVSQKVSVSIARVGIQNWLAKLSILTIKINNGLKETNILN